MNKKLVIDISHWDGDIDLGEWKRRRGLWGVIIKAGGHETNLGRYRDPNFETNYTKAKQAGLHIGYYYYSVSTNVSDAVRDADHMLELIGNKTYDLPLYIDVEDPRQFSLSRRTLTDVIKGFIERINNKDGYGGIYTGGSAWLNNVYSNELTNYANWIAWWRGAWPSECGDLGMWQQGGIRLSDGNIVYGDEPGYTDCDWCIVDYPSIINKSKDKNKDKSTSNLGTADSVIKIAEGELGYYAPADPLPGSRYGRWLAELTGEDWLAGPSTSIWWCCCFVSYCLNKAGVVVKGFPTYNTDVALAGGARNYIVDKNQVRRGDILIFDWNWSTDATDHIGIAKGSLHNGYVDTIEGNVSNSVKNMTRGLSQVRYCIRPHYSDSKPVDDKLEVDGVAGVSTVTKLQHALGCSYCDGVISGQVRKNYGYFNSIVSVTFEATGSPCVEKLQKLIGATVDGVWGKETTKKLQQFLKSKGYDVGVCGCDGYFGSDSCCALQRCLNDNKLK